ncbi:MAG: hypothetical protein ACI82A_003542, partial [Candidatus Azotimanducaceae bacterium]
MSRAGVLKELSFVLSIGLFVSVGLFSSLVQA